MAGNSQVSFIKSTNSIRVNFKKLNGETVFVGVIELFGREYVLKTFDIPPYLNSDELKDIAHVIDECNGGKHF